MPDCHSAHPDHQDELSRINRAVGQLEGIKKMIDERRYCPDIIIQLRAVHAAIRAVETNILKRHLEACVTDALQSDNSDDREQKIRELTELFRRFD